MIPNEYIVVACGAAGFFGAAGWFAWSRFWDWCVGAENLSYKVSEMDRATACLLNHHQGQLDAAARHIAMGNVERRSILERLDKLESQFYNAPEGKKAVPYGSSVPEPDHHNDNHIDRVLCNGRYYYPPDAPNFTR